MSSLVDRLRARTDRKPIYSIDESDDEADILPGKHEPFQENFERVVRSDTVCLVLSLAFFHLSQTLLICSLLSKMLLLLCLVGD